MFTYFHSYLPETWQAQVDRGLIGKNAGIRFSQSLLIDEPLKFNRLAAKDGPLWALEQEARLPLYIDRLQGGCYFEGYDYDESLLDAYRNLLGDGFFGFQMHEWMSNLWSDLCKLRGNGCPEWTADAIRATIRRAFPFPHLFLEAMSAEELAEAGPLASLESFLAAAEALFERRMRQCRGQLIPCDSFALSHQLEVRLGARRLMPEIGAQTPDTRVQIAYARGMARAHRFDFGAYYEPWGGSPFSACCYQKDGRNEWGMQIGSKDFPFETCGENGGSSRSMQRRMHLYAYFAGAGFFSEEWGMCNLFADWRDFELTPYGRVKRDFLRLTERHPDRGALFAPIGIVLPREFPVLADIHCTEDRLFGYPLAGSAAERFRRVRQTVCALLSNPLPMLGTETTQLINSRIPDAFDLLHEDTPDAFSRYEYLIDLTDSGTLSKTHRCCTAADAPALLEQLMPCTVSGNVHWFVNRTKNVWLLVLFNHSGICRTVADGETALREADSPAVIRLKQGALRRLEGDADLSEADGVYHLTLPAGGWFLGSF